MTTTNSSRLTENDYCSPDTHIYNRNVNIYIFGFVAEGKRVNVLKLGSEQEEENHQNSQPILFLSLTRDSACVELLCCRINKNTGLARWGGGSLGLRLALSGRRPESSKLWLARKTGNRKSATHLLATPPPHLLDLSVCGVSSAVSRSGFGGKSESAAPPWTEESRRHFSHISGELIH